MVYSVKHKTLGSSVCWKNFLDAVEEVSMHLFEGSTGDSIEITIEDMSEEEYENLKEFMGY
jgi:hypothetical protein